MSALGHYLEEEGIATVAISLIRPQTENTKPPRALWVPFELGRPFGPPDDPAFQRRVILAALRQLVRARGPVVIAEFADDDPRARPDLAWRPPALAPAPAGATAEVLAARLETEIISLRQAHRHWIAQHGRTTVGLSGLSISDCGHYVADWLRGTAPPSPREVFSPPLMLRFALDDIKAYYLEAAASGGGEPSSRQLSDWLWDQTVTGGAIQAMRRVCLTSEDERVKLIAGSFMVPAARVRDRG